MNSLALDDLKLLVESGEGPCVSLYMPTERAGKETLQNPTRLRNLLREARERLLGMQVKPREADELLQPATDLLDDYPFWQGQEAGLALLLSKGFFRGFKLPHPAAAQAIVGHDFHLKPLLPLVAQDGHFLILALSRKAVNLYRANRYAIEEIPLANVVQSEAEALKFDDPEKSLQVHPGKPGSRGEQTGIIHGHGAAKEDTKERTLRYFQEITRGLHPYLRDERAPLILAGVDYYLPLFREANDYPHLLQDVVPGNPDEVSAEELRRAAWEKVEPIFQQTRQQAAATIEAGLAKDQATTDVEKAVAAACHGRAGNCFVALDEACWGRFDFQTARVEWLSPDDAHARDVLDLAAVQTILNGGEVFVVPKAAEVPGGGPIAVLLRF